MSRATVYRHFQTATRCCARWRTVRLFLDGAAGTT
jgi:hypothetical protein